MQRTDQCKPRIEIHVSRFLERCIYADSDNPYQFKGSDSCVLAQMYLPLSNSGQTYSLLGLSKTHLQNVAIAAAINVDRLAAWFDRRPRAKTRTSRFAVLAPPHAMEPS